MGMDLATLQSQLPQLEACCERLYKSQDPKERVEAEQSLTPIAKSTEYILYLRTILDNSNNPYAQYFACSSLFQIVTEQPIRHEVKLEIQSYFLQYLSRKGPSLLEHGFLVVSAIRLVARIAKLCWFDNEAQRQVVQEAKAFLGHGTPEHYKLGLMLLKAIVQEMHQPIPGRTTTQHRKTAVSFRDLALLGIFSTGLEALRHLKGSKDSSIQEQALGLAVACLSFDFLGTSVEDTAEDLATLQIPSPWRTHLEDLSTLQLFMDYYMANEPPLSTVALECLVHCSSVRRSLFSSEDIRSSFLSMLVNITLQILRTQQGLQHHSNYHEFCRLLGRLRNNYQMSELVAVENYVDWIKHVAEFTINSLKSWQWSGGSVHYLLQLWTRLVSCAAYQGADEPNVLTELMPSIIAAYVTSRLSSVTMRAQDPSQDDPFDNVDQLQEQLESLPALCRFQYDKLSRYFCDVLDPLVARYGQLAQGAAVAGPLEVQVLEGQLTWFVYMIGAIIKGRLTGGSTQSQEVVDGDLSTRVLKILQVADSAANQQRYGEDSRQKLDVALLLFFTHFRKVYVGEVVMHSSKVYERLKEVVGIEDHLSLLNIILKKVAQNLKTFGGSEEVIAMTLALFKDLTTGYMSGKLLAKLDAVNFILASHSPNYYTFLNNGANSRNRTTFYATLARMIFMEDSPSKFKTFTAPLQQVLEMVHQASAGSTNPQQLRANVPAATLAGLFRDLHGIAQATSCRRAYMQLFNWLHKQHFPTILASLEAWADTPQVTVPLLKFMVEFVTNKGQRMVFESSSPNGILLFREISKILVTYSAAIKQQTAPPKDVYVERYKGSALCLAMLARALNGSYVNFGVFELYSDPALHNALEAAMSLALLIPAQDVIVYSKVARSYFVFLEAMCHNHTAFLVQQPHDAFLRLVQCLQMGIKSVDATTSSQCAMAVDNLATWLHKNMTADDPSSVHPAAQVLAQHLYTSQNLFPELLQTLFEIALFEECYNQWSLSRPMLSLILIVEPHLSTIKAQLIASQPAEKQQFLAECLDKLMKDVDRNLDPKNRDRFTQNLTGVRHELKSKNW